MTTSHPSSNNSRRPREEDYPRAPPAMPDAGLADAACRGLVLTDLHQVKRAVLPRACNRVEVEVRPRWVR